MLAPVRRNYGVLLDVTTSAVSYSWNPDGGRDRRVTARQQARFQPIMGLGSNGEAIVSPKLSGNIRGAQRRSIGLGRGRFGEHYDPRGGTHRIPDPGSLHR
ncbi:MAG: hypothetical protein FJW31_11930 [Acidobacteria bacterium]|nr:hypothetical protein [Acidobacteriota bacterium]